MITCSDSAAEGAAADTSGPLAAALLAELGHEVGDVRVVPDEIPAIIAAVRAAIAEGARIVVTTGGTGAGPRDVTPEALRSAGLRELPGLGEAIRAASRERIPAADLSRSARRDPLTGQSSWPCPAALAASATAWRQSGACWSTPPRWPPVATTPHGRRRRTTLPSRDDSDRLVVDSSIQRPTITSDRSLGSSGGPHHGGGGRGGGVARRGRGRRDVRRRGA